MIKTSTSFNRSNCLLRHTLVQLQIIVKVKVIFTVDSEIFACPLFREFFISE